MRSVLNFLTFSALFFSLNSYSEEATTNALPTCSDKARQVANNPTKAECKALFNMDESWESLILWSCNNCPSADGMEATQMQAAGTLAKRYNSKLLNQTPLGIHLEQGIDTGLQCTGEGDWNSTSAAFASCGAAVLPKTSPIILAVIGTPGKWTEQDKKYSNLSKKIFCREEKAKMEAFERNIHVISRATHYEYCTGVDINTCIANQSQFPTPVKTTEDYCSYTGCDGNTPDEYCPLEVVMN
ncbi:hypothetical protein KIH87_07730 [Paraneptunicella aestuarii]|uniref:hypothetical protein n=1 Tax=Paraneptunicella aestuarii TaxID=2831148 RepID=UPI001E306C3B|nr:hypothetical protein [Paraneptunicella aestuarii]UAA40219.1 hypothetical protein KIH87_07730 [Paraneptunicella aestuarii]